VPVQRGGMAAGAVNTGRQLGFALGIAALGSVFETRAQSVLTDHQIAGASGLSRAVAGGQTPVVLHQAPAALRGRLDDAIHAAAVSGVQWAFLVSGIIGVLAGLAVLGLVRLPAAGAEHAPQPGPEPEQVSVG
jgi:hypothetical protein